MNRRFQKQDFVCLLGLFLILVAICFLYYLIIPGKGEQVQIEVNKKVYGTYDLKKNQTIEIRDEKGQIGNVLVIEDGEAHMKDATCPDLICVHQKAISKRKETIVCLPHRVVVIVIGNKK